MPNVAAGALCAGFAFALAAVLAVVLAGVGGGFTASVGGLRRRSPYVAFATIMAAGLLAACISGGSGSAVCTAVGGASAGKWLAQRTDLASKRRLLAVLGSSAGLIAITGAFVRYFTTAAQAGTDRIELYVAVFSGALLFAASAIALFRLCQAMDTRAAACPGCAIVDMAALLLCAWLGYGFVTDDTQAFGFAALLATAGLAAALGVHLMMTVDDRYGRWFAVADGHRSNVRCGVAQRRVVQVHFEWRDDPMRLQPYDDFTQRWTLAEVGMDPSPRVAAASRSGNAPVTRERNRQRQRMPRG
ncbi:MAG TPA: NAD(P)(+) transhydrogenase (Re/Si-specific) subunit beta [Paraburkholderia sp.]